MTEAQTEGRRICSACGIEKDINEFPRHFQCNGGREPRCRQCKTEKRPSLPKVERESDLAGSQATGSRDLPAKPLGGSLLPDPAPFMGGLLSECPEIEEDTGIKDTKEIYMLDLDLSDYTAQYPEVQEELAAAAHVHIRSMKDQAFYYIVRGLKEDKSNGGESH